MSDTDAVKRKYGAPNEMKDPRGRAWERPKGRHGGDVLRIRGAEIAAGFHWDVGSGRNDSELTTTTEIWSLPTGAYLNVTPNAKVRSGQKSARAAAKRTLQLTRDAEARDVPAGKAPGKQRAKQDKRRRRR